jgi:predicted GNAT superfamily acetyltransferase
MMIPVFADVQYTQQDGFLTAAMQIYHDQLNQALQNGLSDNGWTFPPITAANLAIVAPKMPDGTGWYESDAQVIVFKLGGALRKVTTTAYP